jgi:hypothetical protein
LCFEQTSFIRMMFDPEKQIVQHITVVDSNNEQEIEEEIPTSSFSTNHGQKKKKPEKVCENSKCSTTQTPLWRKGWMSTRGRRVSLCNACGLHYRKGHFCKYCNEIYRDVHELEGSEPWICCQRCERWAHKNCAKALPDIPLEPNYLCTDCLRYNIEFFQQFNHQLTNRQYPIVQHGTNELQHIIVPQQRNQNSDKLYNHSQPNPTKLWIQHSFDDCSNKFSQQNINFNQSQQSNQQKDLYNDDTTYLRRQSYATTLGKREFSATQEFTPNLLARPQSLPSIIYQPLHEDIQRHYFTQPLAKRSRSATELPTHFVYDTQETNYYESNMSWPREQHSSTRLPSISSILENYSIDSIPHTKKKEKLYASNSSNCRE